MEPATMIGLGLSAIQGIFGGSQASKADKEMRRLKKQRRAYQTPEEIFTMLEATQSRASTGFDPATLQYLTGQTDQAFGTSVSAAKMLGADPNSLSAMFNSKVDQIMKVGAENHALNLANFNKYLGALEVVASNDAAEQKSRQDMLKDDIQAAAVNKQAGVQNIGNAINSGLGFMSAELTSKLYEDKVLTPDQQWKNLPYSKKKQVSDLASTIKFR